MELTPNTLSRPLTPKPVEVLSLRDQGLMHQARQLEAAFLSEMLGHAGLGAASESFSGGVGEEQFSSFLRQEQANMMVSRGGIGLAQQLFEAMRKE